MFSLIMTGDVRPLLDFAIRALKKAMTDTPEGERHANSCDYMSKGSL